HAPPHAQQRPPVHPHDGADGPSELRPALPPHRPPEHARGAPPRRRAGHGFDPPHRRAPHLVHALEPGERGRLRPLRERGQPGQPDPLDLAPQRRLRLPRVVLELSGGNPPRESAAGHGALPLALRPSPMTPITVCHLGRVAYRPAWALQRRVQERLIAAKRAGEAEGLPHVLLVVEHPPVFTLGKSGDTAHLLLSEGALAARGAEYVPVDRGGDVTFHGPGQLVAYPILDLDRLRYPDGGRGTDIHRYLR